VDVGIVESVMSEVGVGVHLWIRCECHYVMAQPEAERGFPPHPTKPTGREGAKAGDKSSEMIGDALSPAVGRCDRGQE
jgi:hypothetical protein